MYRIILAINIIFLSCKVFSGESITIGKTFDIIEPDVIKEIKQQAEKVDLKSWMTQNSIDAASAFQSINLPSSTQNLSFLFDPTYTLPHDIVRHDGKILWPKGTKVNVYERIKTTTRTIVVSDDPKHFAWLNEVAKPQKGDFVFLAGGNVLLKMQLEKKKLYLLDKRVVERFGLRSAPSIVKQEGNRLRVTEYCLGCKDGKLNMKENVKK